MTQTKKRFKPLYKKFLRLRVNPLNNNKLLELKARKLIEIKKKRIRGKTIENVLPTISFKPIHKFKKNKWKNFLEIITKKYYRKKRCEILIKEKNSQRTKKIETYKFYKILKPYTFHSYTTSKFASPGNSFKRKFRNDLFAKKIFNYMYGGLLKKYLKNRMTELYYSKTHKNHTQLCIEFFESRLDAVLYRAKFSPSIKNARQLITHKHVRVNNKIEKNGSYILKQGDLISFDLNSRNIIKKNFTKQFHENPDSILWPTPPNYLHINYNTLEIIFGEIKNFNFTTFFPFKIDTNSLITSYYRH